MRAIIQDRLKKLLDFVESTDTYNLLVSVNEGKLYFSKKYVYSHRMKGVKTLYQVIRTFCPLLYEKREIYQTILSMCDMVVECDELYFEDYNSRAEALNLSLMIETDEETWRVIDRLFELSDFLVNQNGEMLWNHREKIFEHEALCVCLLTSFKTHLIGYSEADDLELFSTDNIVRFVTEVCEKSYKKIKL